MVIEMNVSGGQNLRMRLVLDFDQALGQISAVVVINYRERTGNNLIPVASFVNQVLTN